jgi:prepilin-type N-terminal cleavage/methylation domain-containing protein
MRGAGTSVAGRRDALRRPAAQGFTLIELMIVIAIIAVVAIVAIPNLMESTLSANESATVASMKNWLTAQNVFRRADYYGCGHLVFANPTNGNGSTDLFEVPASVSSTGAAIPLKLVDVSFAKSLKNAKSPYTDKVAKSGYFYCDLATYSDGSAYDYQYESGFFAAPAVYGRTGRKEFVIDTTGAIFEHVEGSQRDPQTQYPDVASGWTPPG